MSLDGRQLQAIEVIEFRRQLQINSEIEYNSYWKMVLRDGWFALSTLIIQAILLFVSSGAKWGDEIRFVVEVIIMLKLSLLIPLEILFLSWINLEYISLTNIQLIKLITKILSIGWYLYAWVKFFQKDNNWKSESIPLYIACLVIVVEGFVIFFIICFYMILISYFLISTFLIKKNVQNERRKIVKIKDILRSIASLKLSSKQFNSSDDWVICWDEFWSDQQIIRLPWSPKHYFHINWIWAWTEQRTVCPICKAPITEEALSRFKNIDFND